MAGHDQSMHSRCHRDNGGRSSHSTVHEARERVVCETTDPIPVSEMGNTSSPTRRVKGWLRRGPTHRGKRGGRQRRGPTRILSPVLDTLWSTHVEPALRSLVGSNPKLIGDYRVHLQALDAELVGLAEKVGKITGLCAMLFPVPPETACDYVVSDVDAKLPPLEVEENVPPGVPASDRQFDFPALGEQSSREPTV